MLEFNNLSKEEKVIANYFLIESKRYFGVINESKDFIMFLDLFNKICNERNSIEIDSKKKFQEQCSRRK